MHQTLIPMAAVNASHSRAEKDTLRDLETARPRNVSHAIHRKAEKRQPRDRPLDGVFRFFAVPGARRWSGSAAAIARLPREDRSVAHRAGWQLQQTR